MLSPYKNTISTDELILVFRKGKLSPNDFASREGDTKMKVALSSVPRLKHFNVSVMSSSGFFSSGDFVCYAIFFDDICPLYPIVPIFSNEWRWRWWYMRAFLKTATDLFYTFSLRVDFHNFYVHTCVKFTFAKQNRGNA